jgi:hypothetical protein
MASATDWVIRMEFARAVGMTFEESGVYPKLGESEDRLEDGR